VSPDQDPDHYLVPWERLVRSNAETDQVTSDNIPQALRLEASEEFVELRDNLNNVGFQLFEVTNGRNEDLQLLDTTAQDVEVMEEIHTIEDKEAMEEMEKNEAMEEIKEIEDIKENKEMEDLEESKRNLRRC